MAGRAASCAAGVLCDRGNGLHPDHHRAGHRDLRCTDVTDDCGASEREAVYDERGVECGEAGADGAGGGGARGVTRDIAVDAADIWPDYRPTRLIELPALARALGVGRVLVKLECERPLGNFKMLCGMMAGLRALARVAGAAQLAELRGGSRELPQLVCA